MSNEVAPLRSIMSEMAHRYGMEAGPFEATLRATIMPPNTSKEELAAFLLVAKEHGLNPITREIYAFPKRGGGVQPIVGIDGWTNIINSHPAFDGMTFEDTIVDGKVGAITCRIFRKDRSQPIAVTEYLSECDRGTEPWRKWPIRMLRHKATIQCARYAFSLSGIIDPDEYERGVGQGAKVTPPPPPAFPAPHSHIIKQLNDSHAQIDLEEAVAAIEDEAVSPLADIPVATDILDPDVYLDDLGAMLSTAQDQEALNDIWNEHMAIAEMLYPPDREKATEMYGANVRRVEKASKKK
jgi:phage recombination protein Bet